MLSLERIEDVATKAQSQGVIVQAQPETILKLLDIIKNQRLAIVSDRLGKEIGPELATMDL